MDVPTTVETALADRPVEGAACLEAGAGAGNATVGLLAAGAERVHAVTDDRDHARSVRERASGTAAGRVDVVEADVRALPLPDDSVEVVTAHGLFNVLPSAAIGAAAAEVTRVAAPGSHLVVDDYEPPPDDAAVRGLFAVENAASELAAGRPALVFYPAAVLRRLFEGHGWAFDRERTLLDPVPWTENHVEAHADAARSLAADLPAETRDALLSAVERRTAGLDAESTGTMYSLALRLPE